MPSNLIIFEDDIDYIPNSKKSTGTWHDLVMRIYKMYLLDILNELLIRSKELGGNMHMILSNNFGKLTNTMGLTSLDKVVKEKDQLRNLNY